jgi:hypothetical protein
MSEPFDLDDSGAQQQPERKQEPDLSLGSLWQKAGAVWSALWDQSVIVKRRGETVIQLPLPVAIALALFFPHGALVVLVVGLIAGYSMTIVKK